MTQRLINNRKYPDVKITLTGDLSGTGSPIINTTINAGVVGISNLSATGTPSSTTYLRGDNTWATISSGGITTLGAIGSTPNANGATITGSTLNLEPANATYGGALSSTDWSTFNSKESALTFSTGLTRTTNTITANLSTGVSGGQSVIGGTASGNNLTLSSTSNATKGKIIFGTSAYDEVNNRLGIGTTVPPTQMAIVNAGIAALNGGSFSDSTLQLRHNNENIGRATAIEFSFGNGNNSYVGSRIVGETASAGGGNLHFQTGSGSYGTYTTKMIVLKNGNVGIGQNTPTAYLHLKAGSATANTAPLKFTSGTNLTTAEAGAMEYGNSSLFFTRSGTLRAGLLMTDIASPFNTYDAQSKGTAFTSGTDNFLGGYLAGGSLLAGVNNVMIGTQAGNFSNTGLANAVMIGYFAGQSASGLVTGAVFIGSQAGQNSAGATNSIFIGQLSGFNSVATNATFIGNTAGNGATNANDTVGIGQNAGRNATGSIESIYLGTNTGYNATGSGITGDYNIAIGSTSARALTTGSKNVLIGYNLEAQSNTADGQLTIQNIIFGKGNTATGTTASTGGIGIGGEPDACALFEVKSTTKGLLMPRMTTTQRNAIASPVAGLMVYNTTTNKLNVYTTTWEEITSV